MNLLPMSSPAFNQFWSVFPLKVGKLAAEQSFKKAIRMATVDEILAGVERYKKSKPEYADWCHPKTWLNQGRWMDEAPEAPQACNHAAPQTVFGLTKIIEAKQKLMNELRNKHASEGPLSTDWNSEAARRDYVKLKQEIKTATEQLARMA